MKCLASFHRLFVVILFSYWLSRFWSCLKSNAVPNKARHNNKAVYGNTGLSGILLIAIWVVVAGFLRQFLNKYCSATVTGTQNERFLSSLEDARGWQVFGTCLLSFYVQCCFRMFLVLQLFFYELSLEKFS